MEYDEAVLVNHAGSYWVNRPIIMDIIRGRRPARVLDLGVGSGYYGEMIRRDLIGVTLDGVELWDYRNPRWDSYDKIMVEDVRTRDYAREEPYDLYLMVDIIEHMTKEEGLALLERIPGPVLVSTPHDFPQEADENPYQAHVSKWTVADFAGFKFEDHTNYLSVITVAEGRGAC
jgi:2-polyprenyl-3-methyl-5-hydroxy-6-metoxy-1,4-benzoquinol methylase